MDILKYNPEKVFFTSDTHFGHKSIIHLCNRPFESVEEMNEKMIENWNNTVPEDGIVFHLGDVIFGGAEVFRNIMLRLNGNVHLIMGNHELKNLRQGFYKYFEDVKQQDLIQIGNNMLYLNHYPMLTYKGIFNEKNPWIQLFGHVHTSKYKNEGGDFNRLKYLLPSQYDVGVDLNDFTPVSFYKIKDRIDYQVEHNINCTYWINND